MQPFYFSALKENKLGKYHNKYNSKKMTKEPQTKKNQDSDPTKGACVKKKNKWHRHTVFPEHLHSSSGEHNASLASAALLLYCTTACQGQFQLVTNNRDLKWQQA